VAFILEIGFDSHQHYIGDYLGSFFEAHDVEANVSRIGRSLLVEADENDPRLEAALHALNEQMPYSFFMTSVSHRFSESAFHHFRKVPVTALPLNLGLCNRCREEMLDPSSRRYYYPFASCRHCGPQYAFFEGYPYERAQTSWRSVQPCPECEQEAGTNPFRRDYAQISCHGCGVVLEMTYGGKRHCANDAASCKQLFETAAGAISGGQRVVMKTTFGYRKFSPATPEHITDASRLLHINNRTLTEDLSLTRQEIEALYSLEKPLLKAAVQCESLRALFGNTVCCKIPDEGFTFLLGRELEHLHIDHVVYEECGENAEGECRVTFDLPMTTQSDLQLFIGADSRFVKEGERVSFPAEIATPVDTLSVTESLIAVNSGRNHLIDRMEHFEEATAAKMNLLEGCDSTIEHSNIHRFSAAQGALMGALASHKLKCSAVGVYFEGDEISFLHCNGRRVTTVVPPVPFEPAQLIESLTTLREGSERLMANVAQKRPELYAVLKRIEAEEMGLFDALAALIGLEGGGFEALDSEALKFAGQGGTQVDARFNDSRFHPYAFLASVISYIMADVPSVMLSYSVFESLGDYFVEILTQLQSRTQAEQLVLCGAQVAQASLYSRIEQKTRGQKPLLNRSFPIGRTGAVVGGIYL
jgi:hydrogenase maturation protein HypF